MTTPSKPKEYNHADKPARWPLERLGWVSAPRGPLEAERDEEGQAERPKDFGLNVWPIMATIPNDGPEFRAGRGLDRQPATNAFVDLRGQSGVLVVADVSPAGFDAPMEQVLCLKRHLVQRVFR